MSNKELSMDDLFQITEILANNEIYVWADYGTLLGFIREGSFISWEEDIDLGCFQPMPFFEKAKGDLEEKNWICIPKYGGVSIQNLKHSSKMDIKFYKEDKQYVKFNPTVPKSHKLLSLCDFVEWMLNSYPVEYKYETIFSLKQLKIIEKVIGLLPRVFKKIILKCVEEIHYEMALETYEVSTPIDFVLPIKTMEIKGSKIYVPNNPENYLKHIYGKMWRIPVRGVNKQSYTECFDKGKWVKSKEEISKYVSLRMKKNNPKLVKQVRGGK